MRPCYICHQQGSYVKAAVYFKTYRLALCKKHLKEWIEKRVKETIKEFKLIEPDDRLLVAVSGGKDSLALWWLLSELGYDADGLFVDLEIPNFSEQSKALCEKLANRINKKLITMPVREIAGETIAGVASQIKKVCALCGRYKRQTMNEVAQKHGYTVIATGHHLLDEAGALLYNLVNWSTKFLKNFGPKKERTSELPAKVKPLIKLLPDALKALCDEYEIEYQVDKCPYSKGAKTPFYEEFLLKLDKHSPGLIHNFYFYALKKLNTELNFIMEEENES